MGHKSMASITCCGQSLLAHLCPLGVAGGSWRDSEQSWMELRLLSPPISGAMVVLSFDTRWLQGTKLPLGAVKVIGQAYSCLMAPSGLRGDEWIKTWLLCKSAYYARPVLNAQCRVLFEDELVDGRATSMSV